MGDDFKFTAGQKNKIYNDQLKPLKLRISQILLYDTKAAITFLQQYNELIENTPDNELMDKITELEFRIAEYEKGQGKEKSFEDKSQTIISQIEELNTMSENLSLDDFEQEVSKLIENYKDKLGDYNFGDRDEIEDKIYELKAKLVIREVNELYPDNIDISIEDEIGLMMYLNKELNRLQQNKNPKAKSYVERVKYNLMSGAEALHNSETWKLLSYAQRERFETEITRTNQPSFQTTALSVIRKPRIQFNLMQKIVSIFSSKNPKIPLRAKDLGKISLDWLARYIPSNMLEAFERQRLSQEKRNPKKIYPIDSKSLIYWIMEQFENTDKMNGYVWNNDEMKFVRSKGIVMDDFLYLSKFDLNDFGDLILKIYKVVYDCELKTVNIEPDLKLPQCIDYADFIDKLMGTDFKGRLVSCMNLYCLNKNKIELTYENDYENFKKFCPPSAMFAKDYKVYKGLFESIEKIQQECRETKDAFWKEENQKREAFYKAQEHGIQAKSKEQQFRSWNQQDNNLIVQAKSKEQQFRSRIQSDIKIYKGDFLNTGDQKNQEENEKVR